MSVPAAAPETTDAAQLAAEAMDLVGSDPLASIARAEQALGLSRQDQSGARTLAWRAIGLAARARGDLGRADEALRRAVRAAQQAGDRASAAEARMTLSFVLLDLGRTTQALRQSARAAADLDGIARLRLEAQRALVLQRCGRFVEALATYDVVVPGLARAGDQVWEARVRSNRGVLHAFLGDLAAAERDLVAAYDLRLALGRELESARTLWNLGCLARERGDVVRALERFDTAEPVLNQHGAPAGQHLFDRASLLLAAGVVEEARELAQAARSAFAEVGQAADLLECDALLARIALLQHDPQAAVELAGVVLDAARSQGRATWQLMGRLLELLALEELDPSDPALHRRASALVRALDDARWSEAATDARLAAARIAVHQRRLERARAQLDVVRHGVGRGPAAQQVRYWHAEAALRSAAGDDAGASRAVRSGLAVLARHRAGLGASDLQAHVPTIGESLASLGLRIAIASGSALRVLREIERWRGQDLAQPVRPPRDPELSAAVERLHRASAELRGARFGAGAGESLVRAVAARERDVVRLSRRSAAGAWGVPSRPAEVAELGQVLHDAVLVELLAVDGSLHAVTLPGAQVGVSRPRLHHLGPLSDVQDALEHLQFALARLATGRGSHRALVAARDSAQDSARRLDALLLEPLRPRLTGERVVLAPTEALHAVPWSLLPTLRPSPVHVVRSGSAWVAVTRHRERARAEGEAHEAYVTGPGVTLAPRPDRRPARREQGSGAVVLDGSDATVQAALQALDGASTAHVAAHGTFRSDNPLLSSLQLADGQLTVYDLEGLRRPPGLVVLAACHSAAAQVLPGNQLLGVAHALLSFGAGGVVATTLPTPDRETAVLMDTLHAGLAAGLDAGVALHRARRSLDPTEPAGLATSAGFELYGC
ncbi:MAG: CHAT domain-containing protein [Angustibacter sp.]